MEDKKNTVLLTVIAIVTLLLCVIGATFAYFQAQGGIGVNANVNVTTNTTDNLSFFVGNPISFSINQENFGPGDGNQSGETYARATLTANNATNNATANYYIYLDIQNNDFVYTTEDNQAEMLLKITNPEGSEVTTLDGYNYVTSGSVSGFDITTSTGLITIADNYEIVSTGTVTQEWKIEIIFVNLDSDQNENTGKSFSAELIIQKEPMESEELAYHETCTPGTMACDIARLYTEDGVNDLYHHDGSGTYGAQEAVDNSYRYAGANPNNYVCFGSDEETCPADNLYRIIGVFGNQVKLIKSDYAGQSVLGTAQHGSTTPNATYYKGSLSSIPYYYWSGSSSNSSNTWSSSTLNTSILNGTYLNTLGSKWSSLIATTNWKVGGITTDQRSTPPKSVYNYEVGSSSSSTTYSAKVGLMYISDYGFAASPANWNTSLYDYDNATNRDNNWMFMGAYEWTISRTSDTSNAFLVFSTGNVSYSYVNYSHYGVRPSFYLESSVVLSGGSGTSADPYRVP